MRKYFEELEGETFFDILEEVKLKRRQQKGQIWDVGTEERGRCKSISILKSQYSNLISK